MDIPYRLKKISEGLRIAAMPGRGAQYDNALILMEDLRDHLKDARIRRDTYGWGRPFGWTTGGGNPPWGVWKKGNNRLVFNVPVTPALSGLEMEPQGKDRDWNPTDYAPVNDAQVGARIAKVFKKFGFKVYGVKIHSWSSGHGDAADFHVETDWPSWMPPEGKN